MGSGKLISKNSGKDHGEGFKCALISGPPGVGKTITARLVSKECGFDLIEYNATDTRSKKKMREVISYSSSTISVVSGRSKRLILMDEIDGMIVDRGGLQELIDLINKTRVPVICISNDRYNEKMRNLANHCFDLKISKPRIDQLKKTLTSVCSMEGISIKPDALLEVIAGCQQDVRQILNNLSWIRTDDRDFSMDQARKEVERSRKTSVKKNPWEVCKTVFDRASHKSMSFNEKSDLFFHNRELAGMFVQENYVKARPAASDGNKTRLMILLSSAADCISLGDIIENEVMKNMNYGLLPTAAAFCSVLPGAFLSGLNIHCPTFTDLICLCTGFLGGQIQFPNWLGNNSKMLKVDRIWSLLQMHTRLRTQLNKRSLVLDYGEILRNHIIALLTNDEAEGLKQSVSTMAEYSMLKEDLDLLIEATQWPGVQDPPVLDRKKKTALTKLYNKGSQPNLSHS